ncbi:unnamed protein product [Spirodela intermedia]|uniref:Uncharacterized protein n=1 Tax=Spirodela intermedia TaxID=51605 RepID=A0A7I8KIM6_SPIIN|nr:unnamed protein product [Spirodela intermedia]
MEGEGEGEREREADAGGAGAGPSSLATGPAKGSMGREGGAPAQGRRGALPDAVASSLQQRRVIRWERFLPRRSLRVLLVEPDDSTRHIVTALLRKCSYHVAAVADGIKAWDVVKEKNYNFDLILCEVDVPSISGISLLSKIMGNEFFRNIPVIMMSSHDSVSVVFKCMQKGAVDFLVKPVRKNELRNLWQHVWRRHRSIRHTNEPENMPNNRSVSENMSDNNAASNDVSANAIKSPRIIQSCDDDDNQSSGNKPLTQIGSTEKQGAFRVEDRKSSRVTKSQSRQAGDEATSMANESKMHDSCKLSDNVLGIQVGAIMSIQENNISQNVQEQTDISDEPICRGKELDYVRETDCVDADRRPFHQDVVLLKSQERIINFIGLVNNERCDSKGEKTFCKSKVLSNRGNTCIADSSSPREFSVRTQQLNHCVKNGFQEKDVLNHSAASAFSRYANTGICLLGHKSGSPSAAVCIQTRENAEKGQQNLTSLETTNDRADAFPPMERSESPQKNGNEDMICHQRSTSDDDDGERAVPSRDGIHLGYTEDAVGGFPHPQFGMLPLPFPVGAIPFQNFCPGYGPLLQPMFYHEHSGSRHGSAAIEREHGDIQSTSFHNREESHDPSLGQQGKKENGSETDAGDHRLHTCGNPEYTDQSSNCSRDAINGSRNNNIAGTADATMNARSAYDCGAESRDQIYKGKGLDPNRSHREAALIKFRLKRKDRCFEKKVRYHSRKMLAEQRPRVKGQFVRQTVVDSSTTVTEADD